MKEYKKKIRQASNAYLKYLDYTRYDVIAPHGILDLFQDIAGKHANTYGMSFEEMYQKNQI